MRIGLFIAALLLGCAEDELTRTCKAIQDLADQQRFLAAETAADVLRHQANLIELRTLPPDIRDDLIKVENETYQFGRELNAQHQQNLEAAADKHHARARRLSPAADPCAGKK